MVTSSTGYYNNCLRIYLNNPGVYYSFDPRYAPRLYEFNLQTRSDNNRALKS
jgi:hypothetical protein